MFRVAAVMGCLVYGSVFAQSSEPVAGQGWSVLAGRTVGQGATVVHGQLGWPGVSASLLYGLQSRLDLGARLSLNYAFEGMTTFRLGLKVQGVVKVGLVDSGRYSLGLEFAPGPLFYVYPVGVVAGLAMPVGLVAGISAGSATLIHLGLRFPIFLTFGSVGTSYMPILFAAGLEYFLSHSLAVTFTTQMGPSIDTRFGTPFFAFEALFGVSYKL